ncbi:SMI1/KNR4 family protein [Nonomuraea sp. NPDC002799]
MIGLPAWRTVRLGLASVLLAGALVASGPVAERRFCGFVGNVISCGDPEVDAAMRTRAFTPAEARAVGCSPVYFGEGPDEPMATLDGPMPRYPERTPDPAVAARVGRAWERIEGWLGTHAPATLRKLSPGAEPQLLARREATGGVRLPDELYASYLRHNGAEGNLGDNFQLPGSYGLLGVSDIGYINASNCQTLVMRGDPKLANDETGHWHGSLLPIGTTASGQNLFVNLRTGRVGEAESGRPLRYDGPMGWPSHAAMLEGVATALELGGGLRSWFPTVTSGCELRWANEPAAPPTGCVT